MCGKEVVSDDRISSYPGRIPVLADSAMGIVIEQQRVVYTIPSVERIAFDASNVQE